MPQALSSRRSPRDRAWAQPRSRVRTYVCASLLAIALLVVALLAPSAAHAVAAPWTTITAPGNGNTTVNPISDIVWDGSGMWVVWGSDLFDVEIRRWDGSAWTTYPDAINETTRNKTPAITWDGTKPWVAWSADDYSARVAYWDGVGWTQITSPGTGGTIFSTPDLLWANGQLYAAWQTSTRTVQVASWNGAVWTSLGSPGNSTVNTYPNLAWDGTELHVAWSQASLAVVERYSAGAWVAHSTQATTSSNALPTLEFIDGRLYLMYDLTAGTAIGWWDGVQYRTVPSPGGGPTAFAYGTLEWTGTRLWSSITEDPDDIAISWYDPVAPNAPTALGQFQSDGTTSILSGAWTTFGAVSNLVLKGTMSDAQGSEQLTPWIEARANGAPFASTCGQKVAGLTWAGTTTGAPTGGTGVVGPTTVTGLTNGSSYQWRMCATDRFGFPSAWTALGGSPDLRIDTSLPTATPSLPASAATGVSKTPTLESSYTDPAPANTGTVAYELCTAVACGVVLQSGTSASTASGATATWTPPVALAYSTTYWWRTRATDVAGNVQAAWSAARSFTTEASSLTISVNSGTVALGMNYAGVDASGTSVITVTTDSPGGYQLVARDEDDAWGANSGVTAFVPDWTGTAAVPTTWNPGVMGGFGVTMLSETGPGTKDPRWGTGTTATDFATNKYAGLDATVDGPIHTRTSLSLPADTVTVGWRLNVAASQAPGNYDATIVWTATALP